MIHGLKKNGIFSRKDAESRKKSICHSNFSPYFRCHVQGEVYTVVLSGHGLKGCRVNLYQVVAISGFVSPRFSIRMIY